MSDSLHYQVSRACNQFPELLRVAFPRLKAGKPVDFTNLSPAECQAVLVAYAEKQAEQKQPEHRFTITHQRRVDGPMGEEEEITLEQLCNLARSKKAEPHSDTEQAKKTLPLFIAALFPPEDRSASARTNANVMVVTAICGDYDRAEMPIAEAVKKLQAANVYGAIITSPRHNVPVTKKDGTTTCGPRWRVVAPLRKPIVAVEHQRLAERLNGVFGSNVLGTEGESESRAWYLGSLAGEPDCECHIVEGRFIDEANEIEGLPFPAPESHITLPDIPVDIDAAAIAETVLDAAARFEGGHEGLKQAANLLAPFCLIGAVNTKEATKRLQTRLADTSSRGAGVPMDEAERVLDWALNSKAAQSRSRSVRDAIMLDEMTAAEGARYLLKAMQPKEKEPRVSAEDEFEAETIGDRKKEDANPDAEWNQDLQFDPKPGALRACW